MHHPFQCIAAVRSAPVSSDDPTHLIAACGSKLISTCLSTGRILSEWTPGDAGVASNTSIPDEGIDQERPAKKQKISTKVTFTPKIIKLTISPDQKHAVAVTDDKLVRVFEIQEGGILLELSQRCMPKRPCAIQVLEDNSLILCGDKFGDVYSLPLLPEPSGGEPTTTNADAPDPQKPSQLFKPTATNLTVHTQRNRKTLEAQMKQKKPPPKTKEPLNFEHNLLLGHVSMLTDVLYATRRVDGKQRRYILTADRDEHIRISRGPPQSHIIEGYCLGHTEFVSKLCLVPGTDLLVSGGGDDWLGLWEWPAFKLRQKIDCPGSILSHDTNAHSPGDGHTAVSGIWIAPVTIGGRQEAAVVVSWEKLPVLACFPVSDLTKNDSSRSKSAVKTFEHPILDVASTDDITLISFDVREDHQSRIEAFRLEFKGDDEVGHLETISASSIDSKLSHILGASDDVRDEKSLDDLLYGIANLRKRTGYPEAEDAVLEDE